MRQRVRAIYPTADADRVVATADDALLRELAQGVAGKLGGKVGVAPRIYLKRLVDVLDRIDQYPDFNPRKDYSLVVEANEMTAEERGVAAVERG